MKVLSLGLNEINFEFLSRYYADGELGNIKEIIERHGIQETFAERRYAELEPWIQWVTTQTGKTFAEHGVFRLGDIVGADQRQIWEHLQDEYGVHSVAISPMNAENRVSSPSIFVPDPWTKTDMTGPVALRWLYEAVCQAVNDNSAGSLKFSSFIKLIFGFARCVRPSSYPVIWRLLSGVRGAPWRKALILDVILSNALVYGIKSGSYGFASLFLNAGAHIQHHYWYSSKYYAGDQENPEWYCSGAKDPVLDAYRVYDWIVGFLMRELPEWRLIISTGLSQLPNPRNLYYYRPYDHESFLSEIIGRGLDFSVSPRMSRDFLIKTKSIKDALAIKDRISKVCVGGKDSPLFSVDDRGDSLFCQVAYTNSLRGDERIYIADRYMGHFDKYLVHVSIENAIHRSIGYFIDTGRCAEDIAVGERAPLASLYDYMISAVRS